MSKNEVKVKIQRRSDSSDASDSSCDALVRTRDAEEAQKVAPVCLRDAVHTLARCLPLTPQLAAGKTKHHAWIDSLGCSRCRGNAAGGPALLQGVTLPVTH